MNIALYGFLPNIIYKDLNHEQNFTLIAILVTSSMLLLQPVAQAKIISGTQFAPDVGSVTMDGLLWLSLDHTSQMSRTDIELALITNDDFGSGKDGWRYATLSEVDSLLDQIAVSSDYSYSTGSLPGAEWFLNLFNPLEEFYDESTSSYSYTYHARSTFFYGSDGECSIDVLKSCVGTIRNVYDSSLNEFGDVGMISYPEGTQYKDYSYSGHGSLLVRVPEPSTLLLMATGLAGLGFTSRKKSTKA